MWILPKQLDKLHTSVSVLDTKESEKDLEEFCQMSEKSLMWRSKPSLLRTWLTRWKRNNWMQHLSTRTLRPSHTESFVDKWTFLVEDSLANHSLKLELEKLRRTQDTYSLTSQKESESANQELFSSKMSKESSQQKPQMENQFSDMSSEHWKDWVTKQRLEYSQRVKSASHIKEKESLSWATPNTMDVLPPRSYEATQKQAMTARKGRNNPANLREQVDPTCVKAYKDAKNWLTPQQNDWKSEGLRPFSKQKMIGTQVKEILLKDQPDLTKNNTNGNALESYKLNPDWVEQLMGLPVGWTDFDFSEME